ncbi:MarR family transcriptional regulator [Acuticoccus sediminis]|uniref:MarR family transcriptional regulator n=1 Tax=Acuticoccus sediminis TaxID=2184697 RepID=A0A8B2P0I3_9HYPH|nr:MarR family transcriptional regulator [Acuticoccus sediminis]
MPATAATTAIAERPGFLIRRLHQIHVAIFAEECHGEVITPVQYSVMSAVAECKDADQTVLAHAVGLDRTNMAAVLDRLAKRGLIRRRVAPRDRRMKLASVTPAGEALMKRVAEAVDRAHARTVEALPEDERAAFIAALKTLVRANNALGRAPLKMG